MTLLVASADGPTVWMVADSAITGGDLEYRQREFDLKVIPSLDGRALVGFAGDHHHDAPNIRRGRNAGRARRNRCLDGGAPHLSKRGLCLCICKRRRSSLVPDIRRSATATFHFSFGPERRFRSFPAHQT